MDRARVDPVLPQQRRMDQPHRRREQPLQGRDLRGHNQRRAPLHRGIRRARPAPGLHPLRRNRIQAQPLRGSERSGRSGPLLPRTPRTRGHLRRGPRHFRGPHAGDQLHLLLRAEAFEHGQIPAHTHAYDLPLFLPLFRRQVQGGGQLVRRQRVRRGNVVRYPDL